MPIKGDLRLIKPAKNPVVGDFYQSSHDRVITDRLQLRKSSEGLQIGVQEGKGAEQKPTDDERRSG